MSIFKVRILGVFSFSDLVLISNLKLRFVSNNFWTKFRKNSHCGLAIRLLAACAELLAKYERTKKKIFCEALSFSQKCVMTSVQIFFT